MLWQLGWSAQGRAFSACSSGLPARMASWLSVVIRSTLAHHQLPFAELADAARTALAALRFHKLLSLKPAGPASASHWELTPLGRAVVASTLPPDLGLLLHSRMSNLMSCLVLGGHLHLLFMLQPDPLFTIYDWNHWARLSKDFTAAHRRVAEVEGVQLSYIDRRIAGMRGDAATDSKHARLAGAMLLDMVVGNAGCVHHLEDAWGQPDSITKAGITRGQMQQWQTEISKTAAMAALLASTAGWWQLETLLAPLSAQAAAGVRPELLPLMEVSGMQPSHAAALHAAGYMRPELLVCASESEIAAALAARMPSNPQKRKHADEKSSLSLSSYGAKALVARAAKSVLASARQHAVLAATAKAAEADQGGMQAAAPSVVRPLSGQAAVHQVWPRKHDPLLQQLLDAWQLQPSFAFAVVVDQHQCCVPGCSSANDVMQRGGDAMANAATCSAAEEAVPPCSQVHCICPTSLVLCWADREVAVLHLPSSKAAANDAVSTHIWAAVKAVFGDTTRTATCCGSAAALAALSAAGVQCRLTVDDPCVAFLLWQPRALEQLAEQHQHMRTEAEVLRAAQASVLSGSFRLSVPLLEGNLAAAAQTALLARALMPPLRAILAQHQLCSAYEDVERPLQRVFAGVRVAGLRIAPGSIVARLQESEEQRTVLQHHASELLHGHGSIDIGVPAHVRSLLTQLHLAPSQHEQHHPVTTALQHAVRNALRHNQHHLPLVRCLLTYHKLVAWEQLLKALMHVASGGLAVGEMSTSCGTSVDAYCRQEIVLQPLPHAAALCGDVIAGLPCGLDSLLKQHAAPCLPVVASEGSLADLGMVACASPTPVVACVPSHSLPQQHRQHHHQLFEQWLGMLCSVAEQAPVNPTGPPLPLHDAHATAEVAHLGLVRHWCSLTQSMQDLQVCTSLLHRVEKQAVSPCAAFNTVTYAPGPISLLSAIQPQAACTFVGLDLQQLTLVMVASLSRDPVLLATLSTSDPLAAAASHWVNNNGLHANTGNTLSSRIAAGAIDGTPVFSSFVHCALFNLALEAFVLGQKPSVHQSLLGLEQPVNLADTLLVSFPVLRTWQANVLEECRRTGYLRSLFRKIPFKLPTPPSNGSEARAVKAAERAAISTAVLACCGDLEHTAMAAFHTSCSTSCSSCSFVTCGANTVVAQVPASSAVASLKSTAADVSCSLMNVLKLAPPANLPFWWWWGPSLDRSGCIRFLV
ncbi:hypothetical protein COO60DRAFT_891418 [Scenedesmus sp. NREL 46B-D3]|nr:hypothetical protein COO60DRAFT_891418 [Scenedesmus sp. NREL 46B-D3]